MPWRGRVDDTNRCVGFSIFGGEVQQFHRNPLVRRASPAYLICWDGWAGPRRGAGTNDYPNVAPHPYGHDLAFGITQSPPFAINACLFRGFHSDRDFYRFSGCYLCGQWHSLGRCQRMTLYSLTVQEVSRVPCCAAGVGQPPYFDEFLTGLKDGVVFVSFTRKDGFVV